MVAFLREGGTLRLGQVAEGLGGTEIGARGRAQM